MANVKITIHRLPVFKLLYAPTGPIHNLVERTTNAVQIATLRECPIMDGHMVASIRKDVRAAPPRSVTGSVSSDDEAALWVQRGTGVYGPTGQRIRPRTSRMLRWPDRRGVGFVYRDSVAGQPANPFMWRGLVRGTAVGVQRWTLNRHI